VGVVPAADFALAEELGGFVRVVEVDGDQGAVTLVEGGRHCGDGDGEDVERCGEMLGTYVDAAAAFIHVGYMPCRIYDSRTWTKTLCCHAHTEVV